MIVNCPACGQGFDITGYPERYKFSCNHCQTIIDSNEESGEQHSNEEAGEQHSEDALKANTLPNPEDIPASPITLPNPEDVSSSSLDNSTRKLRPPSSSEAKPTYSSSSLPQGQSALPNQESSLGDSAELDAIQEQFPPKGTLEELPVISRADKNQGTFPPPTQEELPKEQIDRVAKMLTSETNSEEKIEVSINHTMGGGKSPDASGSSDDFDPLLHIEDEHGIDHTLATAPVSESLEEEKYPTESTAISVNPLLAQQAQSAPLVDVSFMMEDPLAQEESTAISVNPLLQNQPQSGSWDHHYGYESSVQVTPNMTEDHYSPNPLAQHQAPATPIPPSASSSNPTQPSAVEPSSVPSPVQTKTMDDADEIALLAPPDRRALIGAFLLIFVVFGPVCVLLGWLFKRRAKEQGSFGGQGLATLAILGGTLQSLLLASLFTLFVLFPEGHPVLAMVRVTVQKLLNDSEPIDYKKLPPQAPRLTRTQAISLIKERRKQSSKQKTETFKELFVYQEPNTQHAYAHWRDRQTKQNRRTLLLYSNRKHWHIASLDTGKAYEVRVSQVGPSKLSTKIARKLLKQFWDLRGKFSGTRITHLYVMQKKAAAHAHAYWKLTKQVRGSAIRQWKIKSLFHHSSRGKWYLSRYASKLHKEELFNHSTSGTQQLTKIVAQKLLSEYHNDNQKSFTPKHLYVYQEPTQNIAYVHWQNGRQSVRSLFRYSNQNRWYLAQPANLSAFSLTYKIQEPLRLSSNNAKKLLMRYIRNNGRKLLMGRFAKAGRKGKSPQRLPKLITIAVFQPNQGHKAWVRWHAKFPHRTLFYESLFHRSQKGYWYLSLLFTQKRYDLRFSRKGGTRLSTAMAKELLLQLWQEDEQSEKFTGARIEAIYTYQKAGSSVAWAHWRKKQSGLATRMRTKFFLSNRGSWYLGRYDMGLGYGARFSQAGQERLSTTTAVSLLKQYFKNRAKKKKTSVLTKRSKILLPYVHQELNSAVANLRWVQTSKGKSREINSLLHRSNDGRWYLSIASTPQLVPAGLQ